MKRIVSLILALAMVLSMASFAAAEEATGIASWKAFDKTVTLQIPVYERGTSPVPVTDNYWIDWIQQNFGDKYNIKVQFIPITRSAVEADYDLLASRQALPTIMMEYDYPKLSRWANDGYLVPIDLAEFAKIAPTYYAKMEEYGWVIPLSAAKTTSSWPSVPTLPPTLTSTPTIVWTGWRLSATTTSPSAVKSTRTPC